MPKVDVGGNQRIVKASRKSIGKCVACVSIGQIPGILVYAMRRFWRLEYSNLVGQNHVIFRTT